MNSSPSLLLSLLLLLLQVFVANPHKPKPILDILVRNRDKLADFLSRFQLANENDAGVEQFTDEKNYVIRQIRELKQPTSQTSQTATQNPGATATAAAAAAVSSGTMNNSVVPSSAAIPLMLPLSHPNLPPRETQSATE